MNEMKHFFNTTSVDTIGECLNGEKLLNASRNEKGNTLLTFESAYEGYSDLLTITPDGSVIGTFICDEEQQPQTVNDTQCAANEIVKMPAAASTFLIVPTSWAPTLWPTFAPKPSVSSSKTSVSAARMPSADGTICT